MSVAVCGLSLVEGMGATLAAARGLLIAASSLVAECGPWGTWASVVAAHGLACSTPGIQPETPALAGRCLLTGPPGKAPIEYFYSEDSHHLICALAAV